MFSPDDDEFSLSGSSKSSKLSGLFDSSPSAGEDYNKKLRYSSSRQTSSQKGDPAKDQKNKDVPSSAASSAVASILFSASANVFKYLNGVYSSAGKLGVAILSGASNTECKLLLYSGQKQPIMSCRLPADFQLTVQPSNYASFYDDSKQLWSMCFGTAPELADFCKWIAITRASLSKESVVVQDLNLVEGMMIKVSDTVDLSVTVAPLDGFTLKKPFISFPSSGPMRVTLGKGDLPSAIEEHLVGMKEKAEKAIVIPAVLVPLLKISSISETEDVVYTIGIVRIVGAPSVQAKSITGDELLPSGAERKHRSQSNASLGSDFAHVVPKNAPAAVLEQDPASVQKAHLLARMSKMGQALPTTVTNITDAETYAEAVAVVQRPDSIPRRPSKPPLPESSATVTTTVVTVSLPYHNTTQSHSGHGNSAESTGSSAASAHHTSTSPYSSQHFQTGPTSTGYPWSMGPYTHHPGGTQLALQGGFMGMPPAASYMPTQDLCMLIAESRVNFSESKMILGKLTEKLDELQTKVNRQPGLTSVSQTTGPSNPMNILQEISCLVEENRQLKIESVDRARKLDAMNELLSDMMRHGASLVGPKSGSSETASSKSVPTILQTIEKLKEEKEDMARKLTESDTTCHELKQRFEKEKERADELSALLDLTKIDLAAWQSKVLQLSIPDPSPETTLAPLKTIQTGLSELTALVRSAALAPSPADPRQSEEYAILELSYKDLQKLLVQKEEEFQAKVDSINQQSIAWDEEKAHIVEDAVNRTTSALTLSFHEEKLALVRTTCNQTFNRICSLINSEETYTARELLKLCRDALKSVAMELTPIEEGKGRSAD